MESDGVGQTMATFQTLSGPVNEVAQTQVALEAAQQAVAQIEAAQTEAKETETSKRRPSLDNQSDHRSTSCPSRSGLVRKRRENPHYI